MDVAAVMEGLGAAVDTIAGLRVYPYPADSVVEPAAIVAFPEAVEFDYTAGRGTDRLVVPVQVLVGKTSDRASASRLAAYLTGGAGGIKAAVEADVTLDGACETVRVMDAEIVVMTLAATDYIAAIFNVEVIG